MKNKQNGITLIALIITIIVLLILAGVTISMIVGENGILNQAVESSIATENATVYEQLQLKVADYQMEEVTDNVEENILERLKEDGYVNSDNTVNVDVLIPNNDLKRGKGSLETGDVYVLELGEEIASLGRTASTNAVTSDNTTNTVNTVETGREATALYYLVYYDENDEYNNLGSVFDTTYYKPTGEEYFEFDEATGGIALKDSDNYYQNGTFALKKRNLGLDTIIIPSTYNGQTVTKIGIEYGDSRTHIMGINATDVRKIILPDTIKEIAYYGVSGGAFLECTSLEEIVLSDSLQLIGSYAFYRCTSLSIIDIPNTVNTIGESAFSFCTSIDTLVIPESVTTVGSNAFSGWTADQTIYVPFSEDNIPSGWVTDWYNGCNATIIYAD